MSTTDESVPENALAGTIPTEIGQLAELRELHAANNQITGVCLQCFCCMVNEFTSGLKYAPTFICKVEFLPSWAPALP